MWMTEVAESQPQIQLWCYRTPNTKTSDNARHWLGNRRSRKCLSLSGNICSRSWYVQNSVDNSDLTLTERGSQLLSQKATCNFPPPIVTVTSLSLKLCHVITATYFQQNRWTILKYETWMLNGATVQKHLPNRWTTLKYEIWMWNGATVQKHIPNSYLTHCAFQMLCLSQLFDREI